MVGAFLGGLEGSLIPGVVLLILFGAFMLAAGIAMIRGRRSPSGNEKTSAVSLPITLGLGGVIGVVSRLVGAGGGLLIVPAMAFIAGLPMAAAISTSLLVIALPSFAGLAGHLVNTSLNWPLTLLVTALALMAAVLGMLLSGKIPERGLRKGFGYFVIARAVFLLGQHIIPLAVH